MTTGLKIRTKVQIPLCFRKKTIQVEGVLCKRSRQFSTWLDFPVILSLCNTVNKQHENKIYLIKDAIFTLLLSILKSACILFHFVFFFIIIGTEILNFDKYSVAVLIHLRGKEKDFSK